MVRKLRQIQRQDPPSDREFILNPDLWPAWPYLPLKRYPKGRSGPEVCLLVATERPYEALYAHNLFHLPPTRDEFLAGKKYVYETVDALLADGWIVD